MRRRVPYLPRGFRHRLDGSRSSGNNDTRKRGAMNIEPLNFEGRVAIVTGAGSGLGRAYARALAARGAKVIVNDLPQPEGHSSAHDVVAEIEAAGGVAAACAESVEHGARIVEAAMDTFKRLDIVINNAGNLRDRTFHKLTDEEWDDVYRVHL